MFNRVKFAINKILFQTSNKESFTKNKKMYNKNNFNRVSVRKFSSFNSNKPHNNGPNNFLIAAIFCGTLCAIKKFKS
jgi:hypothetical protein